MNNQVPSFGIINSNYINNRWIDSYKNFSLELDYDKIQRDGYQILGGEVPVNCSLKSTGETHCQDIGIEESQVFEARPVDENWIRFYLRLQGATEVFKRRFLRSGVHTIETPFKQFSPLDGVDGETVRYNHTIPSHGDQMKFLKHAQEKPNGILVLDSKQYNLGFTTFGDPKDNSMILLFSSVGSKGGKHYYVTDEKAQISPPIYLQTPGLCHIKGCYELKFSPYESLENEERALPNKEMRKVLHRIDSVKSKKDTYLTSSVTADNLFQSAIAAHYLTNRGELNIDFIRSYLFNPAFEILSCANFILKNLIPKPNDLSEEAFNNLKNSITELANSESMRNGTRLFSKEIKDMQCALYPTYKECGCTIL